MAVDLSDLTGYRVRIDLVEPLELDGFYLSSFTGTLVAGAPSGRHVLGGIELAHDACKGEVARAAGVLGRALILEPHEIRRVYAMPEVPQPPGYAARAVWRR
jgi:hypothetical protein